MLAALDTLGIAAMIPLTQLIGGAPPDSGALGFLADVAGTTSPTMLIPLIAAIITVLFIVKSVAALGFRWWLLGRTTRVSARRRLRTARTLCAGAVRGSPLPPTQRDLSQCR